MVAPISFRSKVSTRLCLVSDRRPKALLSVTLELFNSQRQSKELATHSPGVATQKTESVKTIAGQNGLLDFSFKPHAVRAEVPDC
jgi:hypothetical protein